MLEIGITESVGTYDYFGPRPASYPVGHSGRDRYGALFVSVPESLRVIDNLGTYKRWFNGVKFFYTVKSLPQTRK